jgi:photoprotection regulator FRP-like protein
VREFSWSPSEKKAARAMFDSAVDRECKAIRREVEAILRRSPNPRQIWQVHDYLSDKRREIDRKYDYRYSVLIGVFAQLLRQGWITEKDLSPLAPDKVEAIKTIASV